MNILEQDRVMKTVIRWLVIGGMSPTEAIQFVLGGNEYVD